MEGPDPICSPGLLVLGNREEEASDGGYTFANDSMAGYAACAWAFVFAAMSAYWAAGGTLGLGVVSPEVVVFARDSWFVPLLWGVVAAKILLGLLALTLVRPWGWPVPGWTLLAAWGAGILMALHGGANLFVRGLMAAGVMDTPQSMHSTTAFWYLVFWDPWFLLGGILFCAAAWHYRGGVSMRGRALGFRLVR